FDETMLLQRRADLLHIEGSRERPDVRRRRRDVRVDLGRERDRVAHRRAVLVAERPRVLVVAPLQRERVLGPVALRAVLLDAVLDNLLGLLAEAHTLGRDLRALLRVRVVDDAEDVLRTREEV